MKAPIFEALMLVCFGVAWPFSIYRMIKTKRAHGKSQLFLSVILAGYIFGVLYQISGERSAVIYLYLLNAFLVTFDLFLTIRYSNTVPGSVHPTEEKK